MFELHERSYLRSLIAFGLLAAACGDSSPKEVAAPTPPADDLLSGGDFTNYDASVWRFTGPGNPTATPEVIGGYTSKTLALSSSDLGPDSYSSELTYWDAVTTPNAPTPKYLTLSAGGSYRITLRASSSKAGSVIHVVLQTASYEDIEDFQFTLTAAAQDYDSGQFTISGTKNVSVAFKVEVGGDANAGATIYLDDLHLISGQGIGGGGGTGGGGGGGGGGSSMSRDLFGGNGSFETVDQQANWFLNLHTTQSTDSSGNLVPPNASDLTSTGTSLTFAACSGLTGNCAGVSSPNWGGGTSDGYRWFSQMVYGANKKYASLSIDRSKTYHITFSGKIVQSGSSTAAKPGSFSIWMQETWSGAFKWPPLLTYNGTLTTTAKSYDTGALTMDTTNYGTGTTCAVEFAIVLGNDGNNNGVTFSFDEIKLIEQ